METLTATKVPTSALIVGETVPPTTLPGLPVAVSEPALPPKPSRITAAWEGVKESPHGRTLRALARGTGGFLTSVTPPIVLAGVGYAVGGTNPYEASLGLGIGLGVVGGLLTNFTQFGKGGLVESFKKLGSKHPYIASCANVLLCIAAPAAAAGLAASHYAGGGWGVGAGVAAGILGAIYCEMVQDERRKDAKKSREPLD